jgi:hypothetical protein
MHPFFLSPIKLETCFAGADVIEASAKTATGVAEAFERVVRTSYIKGGEITDPETHEQDLTENNSGRAGGCC